MTTATAPAEQPIDLSTSVPRKRYPLIFSSYRNRARSTRKA